MECIIDVLSTLFCAKLLKLCLSNVLRGSLESLAHLLQLTFTLNGGNEYKQTILRFSLLLTEKKKDKKRINKKEKENHSDKSYQNIWLLSCVKGWVNKARTVRYNISLPKALVVSS